MRLLIPVLFWVGMVLVIREWRYAKKVGVPITRPEKGGLFIALALWVIAWPVLLFIDAKVVEIPPPWPAMVLALFLGLILNTWGIRRMIRRAEVQRGLSKT